MGTVGVGEREGRNREVGVGERERERGCHGGESRLERVERV